MGAHWAHMGPHGLHGPWAMADGPRPMGLEDLGLEDPGLEDPPVGVYFRARGRWGPMGAYSRARGRWDPMGSMGLGDPPMGVSIYIKSFTFLSKNVSFFTVKQS